MKWEIHCKESTVNEMIGMDQWARRVVEITDAEQKKRMKKWGQFKKPLGKHSKNYLIKT